MVQDDRFPVDVDDADLGLLVAVSEVIRRPMSEVLAAALHRGCEGLRADLRDAGAVHAC